MNVATVRYSSRLDSLKDDVEVVVAHSKTVVNHGKGVGPLIKIDSQSIVHVNRGERPYTLSSSCEGGSVSNETLLLGCLCRPETKEPVCKRQDRGDRS